MFQVRKQQQHKPHNKYRHSFLNSFFLPILGMRIDVNVTRPVGKRLISIWIRCEECSPVEYIPIDLNRFYRIITPDFLAKGGNGYSIFPMYGQNYE